MNKIENALYYSHNYDRRQIKTKKAIISAFITLLQEKNLLKISITELAHFADIDRKTFYLHYKSIDSLYNDLGTMLVSLIKDAIIEYSSENKSPYYLFASINDIINEKIDHCSGEYSPECCCGKNCCRHQITDFPTGKVHLLDC